MLRRWVLALVSLVVFGAASGCTTLNGVSLSDYSGGDKRVRESASATQFLFFGYDGDLPHEVMTKLKGKCPTVSGVSAAHEMSWYVFVTVTTVTAEGYCK